MSTREQTILLVSDDAALCAAARLELERIDDRLRVAAVSTMDAARRIVEDAEPAVILLEDASMVSEPDGPRGKALRLNAAVSSLAIYAPVVVIGEAESQSELSALVAAGAADFVARTPGCLSVALGLVERRLRQVRLDVVVAPDQDDSFDLSAPAEPAVESSAEDFGEVLRHELNNPLTGILGNAELLLAELRRTKSDGMPQGAQLRLETIAALAVRLRETVRRLSQDWEARQHPVHSR